MKKLLSILGSLGMVATAGMAVVACGTGDKANNPSHSYNELKGWIDDSKNDNSHTQVVFVGGRKDVNSLSYLAAKAVALGKDVNPQDIDSINKQNAVDKIDEEFSNEIYNAKQSSDQNGFITIQSMFRTYLSSPVDNVSSALFGDKTNEGDQSVYFHSILVDDISSFFKTGIGKKFRNDYLNSQIKSWSDYSVSEKNATNSDAKNDLEYYTKIVQKSVSDKLKDTSGPFFMIFNNGNLVGISKGYKAYYQLDTSIGTEDYKKLNKTQAITDLSTLVSKGFKDKIYGGAVSWVKALFPSAKDRDKKTHDVDGLIVDNKGLDQNAGWDNADSNSTYNKENTAPLKDDTTFALDLKKYID